VSGILLVEDEVILGDTLQLSIQKLGHTCTWVKSLKEARGQLKNQSYDFWVLDRNLPDGDGIELLKSPYRKKTMVLVLSAKSTIEEKVEGLHAGADDYLPKPFSFQELSARLQALERRRPPIRSDDEGENRSTVWTLDGDTLCVFAPSGWVELTPLEFKFLSYLIERKGVIVSKDRLLREVWGFSLLPKTRTVDYLTTQLRKRIEEEPESPKHLLTVRGAGIKFVE
jgi:two-component system OmpR family response regulator